MAARCSSVSDSSIVRRIHSTTSAAMPPMKKPIRQPQSLTASMSSTLIMISSVNCASTWPPTRVTYWKEEKKPRRLAVAASDM